MKVVTQTFRLALLAATASSITLAACATKAGTGAIVGAAGGAVAGGAIGAAAGSTAKGAIIGAVVDKQAKELKQNIKGAKVERVGEGIQVTFESGLLYDFDSDRVLPTAQTNFRELAKSLNKYPGSDLLIVGHTDQVGSGEYNQRLSERRASAASSYLVSQGVSSSRVSTRGLGETEPVASNETELGRQQNRRVEVAIYANAAKRAAAERAAN